VSNGVTTSRAEEWSYLVQDVDADGVATLHGHLTGFGAGLHHGDEAVPDEALARARATEERRIDRVVTLRLRMDGRLVDVQAGRFADALPHRLLALRLPPGPVERSAEWPLPDLVRTFAALLPSTAEIESQAMARLLEVHRVEEGVDAEIETTGWVRSPGGPAIHLSGSATWDAMRGGLVRRDLLARLTPSLPDPTRNPGSLHVRIERVQVG